MLVGGSEDAPLRTAVGGSIDQDPPYVGGRVHTNQDPPYTSRDPQIITRPTLACR